MLFATAGAGRRLADERLPPPPPLASGDSLFLDFDGTLIELAARPDAVEVPASLVMLLRRLSDRLDGRVAIVTGRSIAQIDALLGPESTTLALSGSHGVERRTPGDGHVRPDALASLAEATQAIEAYAAAHDGMVFERKSFGAGLHYRACPHLGAEADAFVAALAAEHGLAFQRGKMMAEARMAGDKGQAVAAFMVMPPFAGSHALFFGDDVTDEDGFAAVAAHGGAGVLIGEPRETTARYRLDDVAALGRWLAEGIA